MTCETCPFFYGFLESAQGDCRLQPPSALQHNGAWEWPIVTRNAWCGQHPERAALAGRLSTDVVMRVFADTLAKEITRQP